jgi:Cu-processing system permease protein
VVSVLLSFIFSAISFLIALKNENRIRGFGLAILSWLFFAVIYDALFLILISVFSDYNLESFTLGATLFNPIDLSRVIILLKLDISALMGYTGAVIRQFLGNFMGMALAILVLVIWIVLPLIAMRWVSLKKDF